MNSEFPNMELEAIHVPKTAGSTFLLAMLAWYGIDGVLKHYPGAVDARTPEHVAAYGHFPAFTYPDADKRICWVRDPAWRVISEYFFFQSAKPAIGDENPLRTAVHAGDLSLDEYIEHPAVRNTITEGYLKGASLNDFAFIGLSEHFDLELERLALILNKPIIHPERRVNVTISATYDAYKRGVTPRRLAEIREIHETDSLFYNAAAIRARTWYDSFYAARANA